MDKKLNLYVGAYASSPSLERWDEEQEKSFFECLKSELPDIAGLELPFWGEGIHQYSDEFFHKNLNTGWSYTLTCMPGNMNHLALNPHFGLASDNEQGRAEAIKFYTKAVEVADSFNQRVMRNAIHSIQIASSPRVPITEVSSSTSSLVRSLEELSQNPIFSKFNILLEHCDSQRNANSVFKGFLSLDDEIIAVKRLGNKKVGILINWGRSAIEFRSTQGPLEHLEKASKAGVLKGLIFSGASGKETSYKAWHDLHLPFNKTNDTSFYEESSLLTEEEVRKCFEIISPWDLDILGVKLISMPITGSSIERRVGINKDGLKILRRAALSL